MQSSLPQIFCLGVNHNSAPAAIRENLFIPLEKLSAGLQNTSGVYHFSELAALSTCNRFELFGVVAADHVLSDEELLASFQFLQRHGTGEDKMASAIQQFHYLYRNEEAVRHLFTVAASLDSMVVGETQITGQFKDALTIAQQAGTLGTILDRLGQDALAASKKIRTQTDIGKKSVSVCHSAIELGRRIYADLSAYHIAVVGAGNMARIACEHLKHLGCRNVSIINRTVEKGKLLAEHIGSGKFHTLDELSLILAESDVVITATQSQEFIIRPEHLENISKERPIVLLDVSVPRNIDPACNDFEDVYLFDIDDIQKSISQNLDDRKKAVADAWQFIDRGVELYVQWLSQMMLGPILAAYKNALTKLADDQLAKTLSKSQLKTLSDEQKKLITDTAKIIGERWTAVLAQAFKGLTQESSRDTLASFDKALQNEGPKDV